MTSDIQGADLTYDDRVTLHVGDIEAQVIHPGVSHTVGDSVVWLPHRRVLFAGDLVFEGGTPFFLMGSLSGSLRALALLRELGAETVVPGHGPVTDPSAFDRAERYMRFVAEVAEKSHAAGLTPLEAARRHGSRGVRRAAGERAAGGEPAPGVRRAGRGAGGRTAGPVRRGPRTWRP